MVRLQRRVPGLQVGGLDDQPDPIGALGVAERANLDAEGPEQLLALGRARGLEKIGENQKFG